MGRLPMTEAQWAARVMAYAQLKKWRVCHYRPARTTTGWRTPLQGHRGAPDLILARNGKVLLIELKSEKGAMREGQTEWADAIGPDYYRLWRPRDWPAVQRELGAQDEAS